MSFDVVVKTILLSTLPLLESKLGIPYGIYHGLNHWNALLFGLFGNLAVIPLVFFFLDYMHVHFMKIKHYEKLFRFYAGWLLRRFDKKKDQLWPYVAFFAFVALPLPGTGAYTGVLLAWLLGMRRIKAYSSVVLGVVVDGIIVMLGTIGAIKLF